MGWASILDDTQDHINAVLHAHDEARPQNGYVPPELREARDALLSAYHQLDELRLELMLELKAQRAALSAEIDREVSERIAAGLTAFTEAVEGLHAARTSPRWGRVAFYNTRQVDAVWEKLDTAVQARRSEASAGMWI